MSSTTSAPAHPDAEGLPTPPFAPQLVEELMRSLGRAVKTQQLYLPNNPIYQRSIDNLRAAFAPIWRETQELVLQITETEFKWMGRTVAAEASRSEGLPWTFFKDGVREITLAQSFETTELPMLLNILRRVRKALPDEDDLLTLLWEQEFTHFRYRYVDINIDALVPIEASEQAEQPRQIPLVDINEKLVSEAEPERRNSGIVRMEDLDATLYFLDEKEIEYLRSEVTKEHSADLQRNVLSILLDIFEVQESAKVREEVCGIFDSYMLHLLSTGQYATVAYLLHETDTLAGRASGITPVLRDRLRRLPDSLSEPSVLSQLLESLDHSDHIPPQEELDALFQQLRPGTLATVLGWLKQAQNAQLRGVLEKTAARLAAANTAEMLRLIIADDPTVATEAIRRAGELKTAAAVPQLARVLQGPLPELRLAATQTLAEIGSAGALRLLETALNDPERDVRVGAVKALGNRGYRAALPRIEEVVKGRKALKGADLTEKMAYFEAFGAMAGDAGIAPLDALLNGRTLFFRKRHPDIRACAAMALGRIGSPTALAVLRRAERDRDVRVKSAINRAMRDSST